MKKDNNDSAVYRFFSSKDYAKDFAKGKFIRLSTLDFCRKLENLKARDLDEGKVSPIVSHMQIDDSSKEPEIVDDLRTSGYINISGPVTNLTISNFRGSSIKLQDSYVLCFSNNINDYLLENFGKFCVKVNDPKKMSQIIFEDLRKKDLAINYKFKSVSYDDKQYVDIINNRLRQEIGFIKKERFLPEDEARMLFYSSKTPIEPINIELPEVSELCEIVEL